jgi:hypothetical protein
MSLIVFLSGDPDVIRVILINIIQTSKYNYVQLAHQKHFFIGFFIINFITGGEKGERGIFQDL